MISDVTIINSMGQTIDHYKQNLRLGINVLEMQLNNLNSGIYFISIESDNQRITEKLIVN